MSDNLSKLSNPIEISLSIYNDESNIKQKQTIDSQAGQNNNSRKQSYLISNKVISQIKLDNLTNNDIKDNQETTRSQRMRLQEFSNCFEDISNLGKISDRAKNIHISNENNNLVNDCQNLQLNQEVEENKNNENIEENNIQFDFVGTNLSYKIVSTQLKAFNQENEIQNDAKINNNKTAKNFNFKSITPKSVKKSKASLKIIKNIEFEEKSIKTNDIMHIKNVPSSTSKHLDTKISSKDYTTTSSNKKGTTMRSNNKDDKITQHFIKHDITKLMYNIAKETSLKVPSINKTFSNRMLDDIKQRNEKKQIITNKLKSTTPRINSKYQLNTFNRLIKDANRRNEAIDKREMMINKLNNNNNQTAKVSDEDWNNIYNRRFYSRLINKQQTIDILKEYKKTVEQEEEENIVNNIPKKTASVDKIIQIGNRLYSEANKRQLELERKRKIQEEERTKRENEEMRSSISKLKNIKYSKSHIRFSSPEKEREIQTNTQYIVIRTEPDSVYDMNYENPKMKKLVKKKSKEQKVNKNYENRANVIKRNNYSNIKPKVYQIKQSNEVKIKEREIKKPKQLKKSNYNKPVISNSYAIDSLINNLFNKYEL